MVIKLSWWQNLIFLISLLCLSLPFFKTSQAQETLPQQWIKPALVMEGVFKSAIRKMEFIPSDSNGLITLETSGNLTRWKVDLTNSTFQKLWEVQSDIPSLEVLSMAISPDSQIAMVSNSSGKILSYNVATGNKWDVNYESDRLLPSPILTLAFSPDSRFFASADGFGYVDFWQVGQPRPLHSVKAHRDLVLHLKYSKDGRFLFSSDPISAKVFSASTAEQLYRLENFEGHPGFPEEDWFDTLEVSNRLGVVVVSNSVGVFVYDISQQKVVLTIPKPVPSEDKPNNNTVDLFKLNPDYRTGLLLDRWWAGFLRYDLIEGKAAELLVDLDLKKLFAYGLTTDFVAHPINANIIGLARLDLGDIFDPKPEPSISLRFYNVPDLK